MEILSVHFSNCSFRSVPEFRGVNKVLLLHKGAALDGKNLTVPRKYRAEGN